MRHWARKEVAVGTAQAQEQGEKMEVDGEGEAAKKEELYPFAKFDVKPNVPVYDDVEYATAMEDPDWSREETDYLYELCREYDLRWVIITDRYSFPNGKARSMEDLKARYYHSYRNLLAHRTPVSTMTHAEQTLYNSLNFDKDKETHRKKLAAVLLDRTPEEIAEEEYLISELKRIIASKDRMLEERNEIFARLEAPNHVGSIAAYQGSAGLAQLAQMMLNNDKNKKRKSIAAGMGTPTSESAPASSMAARDKKAVVAPNTPTLKRLSSEDETRLGISHHEKLSQGVSVRSSKIGTVKGSHQQKLYAMMTELQIPQTLTMPTAKTVARMDQLIAACVNLIDVRKALDKVEQEVRVERARLKALEETGEEEGGEKEEE